MNLHRHFLGRAGYVGKEDIWYKEEIAKELAREATNDDDPNTTLTQETIESITSRLSDRGERWIKAHTPSNGSPAPHTQVVINNIVSKLHKHAIKHETFAAFFFFEACVTINFLTMFFINRLNGVQRNKKEIMFHQDSKIRW